MKKIYFILSMAAGVLTSCTDSFLDMEPSGNLVTDKGDAITTLNDVKVASDGLYALMASTYYYNASMFIYGDVKGDDMHMVVKRKKCLSILYLRTLFGCA